VEKKTFHIFSWLEKNGVWWKQKAEWFTIVRQKVSNGEKESSKSGSTDEKLEKKPPQPRRQKNSGGWLQAALGP